LQPYPVASGGSGRTVPAQPDGRERVLARGGRALARGGREQGAGSRGGEQGVRCRQGQARVAGSRTRACREPLITIPHKQARGDPHVGADPLARCREN